MNTQKLYIIGNGFDLYHGLKTSYANFCEYVRDNDKDLFDFLECYLLIDLDKDGLWTDFENSLSTFEHGEFFSDHDNTDPSSEKFKLSDTFGLEDELLEESETMILKIRQSLYDWLNEIDYYNIKYKALPLDKEARYLTFNYTPTLSQLYSIESDNILHIHNSIKTNYIDLVFGHGKLVEREPLFDESGHSNRHPYSDSNEASKMILSQFYKDTSFIIKENREFFNSHSHVNEVIVLGHSINEIDMPYFKYLQEKLNDASWAISYYDKSEPRRMQDALAQAEIDANVEFFKLDSL